MYILINKQKVTNKPLWDHPLSALCSIYSILACLPFNRVILEAYFVSILLTQL